ncbi:MAG: glycosyltransferase family 4 protein [Acidobacteriota bacterium]
MNILFLDQFSELGGAQRCLLDLMPALRERGWGAHAALPCEGPLADALRAHGASVDLLHCGAYSSGWRSTGARARFAWDLPRMALRISRLAEKHRADLIYVNGPRLLPASCWAARRRRPLLFHCHSMLSLKLAAWLAGQSLRLARATLVASCRFVMEPFLAYAPPERRVVVYNGVAGCPLAPANKTAEWRIGVIGRIGPEKGQAEFLEAARLLVRDIPECRFVVCGAPLFSSVAATRYADELRRLAAGLPVEFAGWRDDVCAVLWGLDLLVVPSMRREATTRVILEAWSAGVPVVAFRSGGIPEIVAHGETGFLVDEPSPQALAREIRKVLREEPPRLRRVTEAARAAWRGRFTLARYQREMIAVMERAASSEQPPE